MASELREEISLEQTQAQGATIRLHSLSKSFGQRQVLREIDLEIKAGEFVALIGPSGGGKTTLLRIVAGLETPTGGEVVVRKPDEAAATSRVMFQEDRLIPWRRVLENVSLGLPKAELPRAQITWAQSG